MSPTRDILSTPGYSLLATLLLGEGNNEGERIVSPGGRLPKREDATLSGRIKMAMASSGIRNPSELAKKMRIHRQTAHKWIDGQSDKLTPDLLFKLADTLHVNPRWLAFGPPETPVAPVEVDPEAAELIQIRDALPQEAKDDWLKSGRTLVKHLSPKSAANPFPAKSKT